MVILCWLASQTFAVLYLIGLISILSGVEGILCPIFPIFLCWDSVLSVCVCVRAHVCVCVSFVFSLYLSIPVQQSVVGLQ